MQRTIERTLTIGVTALCLVALGVILMLPAGSLVIDLVYQGF